MTAFQAPSHPWDLTPAAAIEVQKALSAWVIREDRFPEPRSVAGVDVGFEDAGAVTRAAVVVLDYPGLELQDFAIARQPTRFPYVPGLLSFREAPAVLEALQRLRSAPDLLLCDGQGLAHPRRFGIACHLGVITGLPTIGVAKTRLIGVHGSVPSGRGEWVPLTVHGEVVGAVLRSRERVKPIYVSIGHRVSLETAVRLVMACTPRYKLPETTRWAHRLASGPEPEDKPGRTLKV